MAPFASRSCLNMVLASEKTIDEETAYESYMNPEPGFQSGPGDSVDAD